MSQHISSSSPLPRAPAAKAAPSVEPAGEPTAGSDGFAALLAGLLAQPVATPPAAEPAKTGLLKGDAPIAVPAADAPTGDTLADHVLSGETLVGRGKAGRPAQGNDNQEQLLGGDATPLPIAAPGSNSAGSRPVVDGQAPVGMPPRDGKPAGGPAGEGKAAVSAGEPPQPMAPPASPVERRPGELRATSDRVAATVAAMREGVQAANRPTAVDTAQHAAPNDLRAALSPIPGVGRLGLAWQADLADAGAGGVLPGHVAVDGIVSSGERSAMAIADQAAGGHARPVQQLAVAIDRAVNGEIRQLTIQLSPRELGTIEIALELDADRRLTVAILAERPETLDLLRQDSRQLERLLGQQGLNLADAGLEFGLMSQERREGRERPLPAALDQAPPAEAERGGEARSAPPTPLLGTAHRLNLSI